MLRSKQLYHACNVNAAIVYISISSHRTQRPVLDPHRPSIVLNPAVSIRLSGTDRRSDDAMRRDGTSEYDAAMTDPRANTLSPL